MADNLDFSKLLNSSGIKMSASGLNQERLATYLQSLLSDGAGATQSPADMLPQQPSGDATDDPILKLLTPGATAPLANARNNAATTY